MVEERLLSSWSMGGKGGRHMSPRKVRFSAMYDILGGH